MQLLHVGCIISYLVSPPASFILGRNVGWVNITPPGDRRFFFMFPLLGAPIWGLPVLPHSHVEQSQKAKLSVHPESLRAKRNIPIKQFIMTNSCSEVHVHAMCLGPSGLLVVSKMRRLSFGPSTQEVRFPPTPTGTPLRWVLALSPTGSDSATCTVAFRRGLGRDGRMNFGGYLYLR